jgi:hypothetical protein
MNSSVISKASRTPPMATAAGQGHWNPDGCLDPRGPPPVPFEDETGMVMIEAAAIPNKNRPAIGEVLAGEP